MRPIHSAFFLRKSCANRSRAHNILDRTVSASLLLEIEYPNLYLTRFTVLLIQLTCETKKISIALRFDPDEKNNYQTQVLKNMHVCQNFERATICKRRPRYTTHTPLHHSRAGRRRPSGACTRRGAPRRTSCPCLCN